MRQGYIFVKVAHEAIEADQAVISEYGALEGFDIARTFALQHVLRQIYLLYVLGIHNVPQKGVSVYPDSTAVSRG